MIAPPVVDVDALRRWQDHPEPPADPDECRVLWRQMRLDLLGLVDDVETFKELLAERRAA